MLYRSLVRQGDLMAGQVYDIPEAEVPQWAGEIEAGFLVAEPEPTLTFTEWPADEPPAEVAVEGGVVAAPPSSEGDPDVP